VLVGHSYVLLGHQPLFDVGWHSYGVLLFFFVSGYLIAGSWQADPRYLRFAEKRIRRIMPALLVVVFITVFLLGPLMTTDAAYWSDPVTWRYLWRNGLLLPFHALPGVFQGNPLPAVNGSLWTLPVEAFMYLCTPLLVRAGPWACVVGALVLLANPMRGEVAGFGLSGASSVIPYFMIGATLKMWNVAPPAIALPKLQADVSYGIYLMAFPVQQSLIALHPGIAPGGLVMATLAIVAPLAWLSWTLIEKPMINRGTGRSADIRVRTH
jgi:peptidoglycan/LPS O-acetylase OafA/YrhL